MNLVSLLIVGAIINMTLGEESNRPLSIAIGVAAALGIAAAVYLSKRNSTSIADDTPAAVAAE